MKKIRPILEMALPLAVSIGAGVGCAPPESTTDTTTTTTTDTTTDTTTTDTTTDTTTTDTTTTAPPVCGDGNVDPGEECDTGDGCDASCKRLPILEVSGYCARLFDGRVKCWGYGQLGALGYEDIEWRGDQPGEMGAALPAVNLGTGLTAVQLASGDQSNCALLSDGGVKCWGHNGYGQRGVSSTALAGDKPGTMGDKLQYVDLGTGRTALAISSRRHHVCAILDDHSLKCWGRNLYGQLGRGDTMSRGDDPGEMGDNLPPVDLGTGKYAVQISTGDHYNCAILNDATVKCWGFNLHGMLGLGDTEYRGDDPGEMGDNLPTVDLGTGAVPVAISVGQIDACVLLDDGRVRCWGANSCLELANPANPDHVGDEPGEMGDNLVDIDFGPGEKAVHINVGEGRACAVLESGATKCWGCEGGSFGLNDSPPTPYKKTLLLGTGLVPSQIYVGFPRYCALFTDGRLKCWGTNGVGQLGLGHKMTLGDQPGEMGDNLPFVPVYDDKW